MTVTLNVNGTDHRVTADSSTPLLYVLRNDLRLNGAKYGCGLGQCGSCTVQIDGAAVFSCLTPIAGLHGRRVRTVEGLGTAAMPGILQQAFVIEQAAQVAAEELDVSPYGIALVTADTWRTPDEGLTAGSHSMQDSGTAIRNAAANVRMRLTQAAAVVWGASVDAIATTGDGHLRHQDGRRVSYGDLARTLSLHVEAIADVPLRDPAQFRTMGTAMPRIDIPAKLTGGIAFLNDLRPPGMLHARVVRGPSEGTCLQSLAVDAGLAVNPDGIRNQIEGGIIQSLSWTSGEAVTFDTNGRTSLDWNSYPILRFSDAPDSIEVFIVHRPNMPFLGVAEAAQGPTAAALGNAFADSTGIRLRDMPLSPKRVKAAISAHSILDKPPSQKTSL